MKCVYVAGPYSDNNVLGVLNNMRDGIRAAKQVFLAGFAPFCPWLDYHFQFMLEPGEVLTVQHYYDYSMSWLEKSDAVLVTGDWTSSKGTKAEIERAAHLGIPIFFSLDELKAWANG